MKINRGDIWLVNLDPVVGSEIAKTRPGVIFSRSDFNQFAATVTVVPISTGRYIPSFHVELAGLKEGSHAIVPQIRVAYKKRLIKKLGTVPDSQMKEIEQKLRFYLNL